MPVNFARRNSPEDDDYGQNRAHVQLLDYLMKPCRYKTGGVGTNALRVSLGGRTMLLLLIMQMVLKCIMGVIFSWWYQLNQLRYAASLADITSVENHAGGWLLNGMCIPNPDLLNQQYWYKDMQQSQEEQFNCGNIFIPRSSKQYKKWIKTDDTSEYTSGTRTILTHDAQQRFIYRLAG